MNDSERNNDTTPAPEKTISDDMLIIVPVRNLVLFPGTVVPVAINRERSLAAAQEAVRAERKVGFVLQHDPDLQSPTGRDLYKVGTVASIVRYVTGQDGTHHGGSACIDGYGHVFQGFQYREHTIQFFPFRNGLGTRP